MSSISTEKLNEKKPKKKNKKKDSVTKSEQNKINDVEENEVVENNSTGFFDIKDFPKLKVSEKQNLKCNFESDGVEFTNNQQWLPVVSRRNTKKPIVAFPCLPKTENPKEDESSTFVKKEIVENILEKGASGSTNTTTGKKKKQVNTNVKENKLNKSASQKIVVQPQRNPNKKKRSDPVFINLYDILTSQKVSNKEKKQNVLGSKASKCYEKETLSGNILDSANPVRSRGKHREIKKKKLTKFKLTIIKERILKSKIRENTSTSQFECKPLNLLDTIDFNSEIKIYLNQLNDKKFKNSSSKKNNTEENDKKNSNELESISKLVISEKENQVHKEKQIPNITDEGEIKFSSKFKEYCDNIITPDLNSSVMKLIEELIKLQDRLFSRDPIKAKVKKRHVSGIREVRKYLNLRKVKLVLIAPNLERTLMKGSVYDAVDELKSMADIQNVPYGFSLDRYKLGRCTKKNVPVSAFAVLNYEGLEVLYNNVLQELKKCKTKFHDLKKPKVDESSDDVNSKVLSTLVSAFQETLKVDDDTSSHED